MSLRREAKLSARLTCLPTSQDKRRNRAEVAACIKEVTDEGEKLDANQPGVTGTCNEQIRPAPNGERTDDIERNQ